MLVRLHGYAQCVLVIKLKVAEGKHNFCLFTRILATYTELRATV